MTKIIVAGDWHGNTTWAMSIIAEAGRRGIKNIIQVGDFGLWDHYSSGVDFLDGINAACMDNDVQVHWLDGNHENFDRLNWYVKNNPRDYEGKVFIRSRVLYCPRGLRWNWGGHSFMTVGGAVSIDRNMRNPGTSWWPGEQLTDAQLDGIDGKVDYLFTHDCPTVAPFRGLYFHEESEMHRQKMNRLGAKVRPIIWFHGHMHDKYDYEFMHADGYSQVYGLPCDGDQYNWGVLDIEGFKWEWGFDID